MNSESTTGLSRPGPSLPVPTLSYMIMLAVAPTLIGAPFLAVGFEAIYNPRPENPPLYSFMFAGFMMLFSAIMVIMFASFQRFKVRHRVLARRFPTAIVVSTANGIDRWEPESSIDAVKANKNFAIVVDETGLTFWGGHREPRKFAAIVWRDVVSVSAARYVSVGRHFPALKVEGKPGAASVTISSLSVQRFRLEIVDRAAHQALVTRMEALRLAAISDSRTPES